MPATTTREQFIDNCKRRLGFPVIQLNLDDDQIEDRVDEALYYYQQFHFDATEMFYLSHALTADDITNGYIDIATVDSNIIGITRIFSFTQSNIQRNMFDIRYQLRLQDIQSLLSTSFMQYYITQTHLSMIDLLLVGQVPIDYSRHQGRLYLRIDWSTVSAGDYIIVECRKVLDPDTYPKVYGDIWLQRYATALIKRQWGENLKLYNGIALVGGVTLNADKILEDAMTEIKELEDKLRLEFELPPTMEVG